MDAVSLINKAANLSHVDPRVLTPYARGDEDEAAFDEVTKGYNEEEISKITCPVLMIQANQNKGGILTDAAVAFVKERLPSVTHVYIPEYDHNVGCYSWETAPLLRAMNTFLETLR